MSGPFRNGDKVMVGRNTIGCPTGPAVIDCEWGHPEYVRLRSGYAVNVKHLTLVAPAEPTPLDALAAAAVAYETQPHLALLDLMGAARAYARSVRG